MKLILQPEGSHLCGQACIAMAAGVSLKRAVESVGHKRGTHTKDVIAALGALGVECSPRLVRISRKRPNLPARAIVAIHRPAVENERRSSIWHWMLTWDGKILDPGGRWPEGYEHWTITSFLEINK